MALLLPKIGTCRASATTTWARRTSLWRGASRWQWWWTSGWPSGSQQTPRGGSFGCATNECSGSIGELFSSLVALIMRGSFFLCVWMQRKVIGFGNVSLSSFFDCRGRLERLGKLFCRLSHVCWKFRWAVCRVVLSWPRMGGRQGGREACFSIRRTTN